MGVPFLILLAMIWALFGLWCFLRGAKFGLLLIGLILVALFALSILPEQIQQYFGYFNKAVRLFTGNDKDVISTRPANLAALLLVGMIILAALAGLLKTLRGAHSIAGFFLGLLAGYVSTAYLLASLAPQLAFLPLPIKIQGLNAVQLPSVIGAPSGRGLLTEFNGWLATLLKEPTCPSVGIIVLIVGFILLVVSGGGRGGKKG
jgi:hypothetical protein